MTPIKRAAKSTMLAVGKVYMSGYAGSALYVYDPLRPWTAGVFVNNRVIQDNEAAANPRQLLLLGSKAVGGESQEVQPARWQGVLWNWWSVDAGWLWRRVG